MEGIRTTDPMVILREKGWCISSSNLLIRAAAYDTVRDRTVLPIHQIKTFERYIKMRRMVRLANISGESNVYRLNLDSS